ncbi:MAG: c-type cytochrome [Elusimicrobia bacterium]|jgi:cytochrome c5|nr:c-type cytochrome [Elusimicrobiota bacterium]MBK7208293.1 c-type cytochrome [Elusimicrobiota bacterium]MBK7545054.1 c-type cytochrome [Elusimicrobiota bacterium]MBK7574573.1 c-type cytochrome [Elusimicrobiota bacterium]MBK7688059.1 c-type cytochrome [Elusimicrobiota bacterium]
MKNIVRVVLVLGLMGAAGSAFAEDAAKLYGTKCAMCHGKKGEGNPVMAKAKKMDIGLFAVNDEATLKKTDEELIKATIDGVGTAMPAYKGKIADAEVAPLITYMRSLAAPAAEAPAVEAPVTTRQ